MRPADTTPAAPGSLRALWDEPGENVGLIPGTSDYAPGEIRVAFLVVDHQGRVISSPRGARVWLAAGLDAKPFRRGHATLEQVGIPGVSETSAGDVSKLYVTHLRVPRPGTYWLLAEPIGTKRRIQGVGNVVVAERTKSPAVGAKAIPSRTPTLATHEVDELTTREPPDLELLRHSVADSLAARKPFVLVFATPEFCTSRTCGPVVDVADEVRKRVGTSDVRFIHVEIYENNEPGRGVNEWVREWGLPSEPWVFLVGRDGRIEAKFEGAVSVRELLAAVRRHLL